MGHRSDDLAGFFHRDGDFQTALSASGRLTGAGTGLRDDLTKTDRQRPATEVTDHGQEHDRLANLRLKKYSRCSTQLTKATLVDSSTRTHR